MRKCILILGLILTVFLPQRLKADTYLSSDSLRLGVSTYDTATYQTLTNADSVVWYRINYSGTRQRIGAQTTGNQETGVYFYLIAACSASSGSYAGYYGAYAKAYGSAKTAANTRWTWKAVPGSGLRLLGINDSTQIYNTLAKVSADSLFAKTGIARTWTLRGLYLRGTSGSDTGFVATGFGGGPGAVFYGGATNGYGLITSGQGTGHGMYAQGGTTGDGIYAQGGSGAGANGAKIVGINADALFLQGGGTASAGLYATGGTNADGIKAVGTGSGSGINAVHGTTGYDFLGNIQGNLSGSANSVITRVHIYSTDTTRVDLSNSFGTLAAANYSATFWHYVAIYADSGAAGGTGLWTQAQIDSMLELRIRYSGDSSNVALHEGDSVPAYLTPGDSLKLATINGRVDATVSSRSTFNPATTRVHGYNTDTTRVDLSNSFGTLTAANYAATFWHYVAVYADSGAIGSGVWTAAELDSIMKGKWRYSGDSSNVLLAEGDTVRAYLAPADSAKLAAIKAKTDKMKFYGTAPNDSAIYSYGINATGTAPTAYQNAQALVHYPLDSTFTQWLLGWYVHSRLDTNMASRSTFNAATTRVHGYNTDTSRADLSNSFGTLAAANFAATFWHYVAIYADSGAFTDSVTAVGRISTNLDKTSYGLSAQERVYLWTEDTTGLATGWAQFFKGRLNANISTRSTFNPASDSVIQKFASKASQASINADSLNTRYTLSQLLVMAKILNGGQYRQRYYRPAATDAPDSLRIFSGATVVARQLYWYNASGKLDSVRTYSY